MPTLGLDTIELVSTLRTAPSKGAPSTDDFNDSQKENLADLTSIVSFINNTLLPLLNALPAEAAVDGIEGRTVLTDSSDRNALFYDSLAAESLTVADSLRLLNGMVETFRTQLEDMGIRVSALQTRLASDNKNDLALALQNLTNTINQVVTTQQAQAALIAANTARLNKLRGKRVSTGAINAGASEIVAVTWTTPMPDNNYTVSYALEDITGMLRIVSFAYQLNGAGINVLIENQDSGVAHTGVVHVTAKADPEV